MTPASPATLTQPTHDLASRSVVLSSSTSKIVASLGPETQGVYSRCIDEGSITFSADIAAGRPILTTQETSRVACARSIAPVKSASPRMTPATPLSRSWRSSSSVLTPPATRTSSACSEASLSTAALCSPETCEKTRRATPAAAQLGDQLVKRWSRSPPGVAGEALGPGVHAHRQPVAGDAQAVGQQGGILGHRPQRHHHPCGAGGEGDLDLLGPIHAAGQLQRSRHRVGDGPDGIEVGRAAPGPPRRGRRGGSPRRPAPRALRRWRPAGPSGCPCRSTPPATTPGVSAHSADRGWG